MKRRCYWCAVAENDLAFFEQTFTYGSPPFILSTRIHLQIKGHEVVKWLSR
jgi:hypothetical protein